MKESEIQHASLPGYVFPCVIDVMLLFSQPMHKHMSVTAGGMMLAADYSQLELRIIAHLSGDRRLIDVLNGGADVFKMIAAQWQGTNVEQVTVKQRQHAKGVSDKTTPC